MKVVGGVNGRKGEGNIWGSPRGHHMIFAIVYYMEERKV
jgi:hypothetical protein